MSDEQRQERLTKGTELFADGLMGLGTGGAKTSVPSSLLKGEANTYVYKGVINGVDDYVGITVNIPKRQAQHGERFDYLRGITDEPLTRRQARAIEQYMKEQNPQYSNKIDLTPQS